MATLGADADDDQMRALTGFELTVNAGAEKIIRQELQRLGAPSRFLIVPGEGSAAGAIPSPVPVKGSIQETALANPLVQRAKDIFKAEVRSVVDLRTR